MNILNRLIKYGIYLSFLLPLIFTSRTMFPWHFGKTVLFQVLIEILLLLVFFYWSLKGDKKIIQFKLLDYLILLFLFFQIVSGFFGVDLVRSFWGYQERVQGVFTWLHFGFFYFIIRTFFTTKKDWLNLSIWAIFISVLSSLIAFFGKYFSWFDNIIDPGVRVSGMIGNSLFFAAYLIVLVFLPFFFYFYNKPGKLNYFWILAGLINLTALYFSQMRGAWLGFLVGLIAMALIYAIFGKNKSAKRILVGGGLILFFIIGSLYIFNQKSDYLEKKSSALSHILDINLTTITAKTRLMAWQIAWQGFLDKPILGWGSENYQEIFDHHYNPGFLEYSFKETNWDKPHNYFLEVLSTQGLVGASFYLAIIVVLIIYLIKIIRATEDEKKKISFIIIFGALLAYIAQNSFGIETSNSLQIWFFLLALIMFLHEESLNTEKKDNKIFSKIIIGLVLIFLVLTPYLVYKNYIFYKSSVIMKRVKDAADIESFYQWQKEAKQVLVVPTPFIWEQAVNITKDLLIFDAKQILNKETLESVAYDLLNIYNKNIQKNPDSFQMKFWLGQLYGFMGEHIDVKYNENSERLLKEAWDINKERQTAAMVLAKYYLIQGKTDEAIEILQKIVELNYDYKEPHWFLGLALVQSGDRKQGIEELEKGKDFAINLNINNAFYLIDVYAEEKMYEKIVFLYKKLIDEYPDNPQYYASLAAVYAELGDEVNVIINLNKAVELQPELRVEAENFLKEKNIDINKYLPSEVK